MDTKARVLSSITVADADVVSCHAFSAQGELLAVCPNTEDVHIFRCASSDGDFEQTDVLSKHSQRVTGLSWSCDGRLVSVSEDRTAYVWEWQPDIDGWRSVWVELKAPRAALCVEWAPNGARFAVGLASRDAAVCHFETAVQCWVAKKVGRCKAAVGAVAWHPTSQFLATGSADRRCMVYDVREDDEHAFGQAQVAENAGAWVNAVAFSPSGRTLAFAAQDSAVKFKHLRDGPTAPVHIARWRGLPFLGIAFIDDDSLIACGFDYVPVLFRQASAAGAPPAWTATGSIDAGPRASLGLKERDSYMEARKNFGGKAREEATRVASRHTNNITAVTALPGGRFSTSALDGEVLVWELTP